jgi:hypothetical protein
VCSSLHFLELGQRPSIDRKTYSILNMKFFSLALSVILLQCMVSELGLTLLLPLKGFAQGAHLSSLTKRSGSVMLKSRIAVLQRGKKGAAFPDYKEAIVRYPVASDLADPIVLKNVQASISLKQVLGQSFTEMQQEYKDNFWLSEVSYRVNYNQNNILDLTYTTSGSSAYPSSFDKHVSVNLKTGKRLQAKDLFKTENFGAIAQMIAPMMQKEILQKIAEFRQKDPDISKDLFAKHYFQSKNIEDFSIGKTGITFYYSFDFPHVIKAAEPSGAYLIPYSKLTSYIRPEGPLGFHLAHSRS